MFVPTSRMSSGKVGKWLGGGFWRRVPGGSGRFRRLGSGRVKGWWEFVAEFGVGWRKLVGSRAGCGEDWRKVLDGLFSFPT